MVWAVGDSSLLPAPVNHGDTSHAIDWSYDGRFLASGSENGTAYIWQHGSNNYTSLARSEDRIRRIAWHPSLLLLATSGFDGSVSIWRPYVETPIHVIAARSRGYTDISWSPDGERLAVGNSGSVRIYELTCLPDHC